MLAKDPMSGLITVVNPFLGQRLGLSVTPGINPHPFPPLPFSSHFTVDQA